MALFKTIEELKIYCPSINRNMEWETFAPAVDQAQRKYILPLLGKAQFDTLTEKYKNDTMTDQQKALLTYVQRSLAYYAFFEVLPMISAMVSDMGITEQESSEGTALRTRQWVYHEMRETAIQNADVFADAMLTFLEENHEDYPDWAGSPAFTITKSLFINTAAEYDAFVPIIGSKRVWLAIRPFLKAAETEYIQPAISEPLFNDLKTKLSEVLTTPLTAEYKALLEKIQPALAWLALYKALPFQAVQFTPGGIVQTTTNTGIKSYTPADRAVFETAMTHATGNGMSALRHLKKWLVENCEDYPEYQDEDGVSQPNYEIPDNEGKKSFMV